MRIFMKYIIRNIWENKLRGFLILFSLMVSTFVVFLNFVARDDIIHQYETLHEESYRGYDMIVNHEDTDDPFFKEDEFKTDNIDASNKLSAITTFGVVDNDELTLQLYGCNRKSYLDEGLFVISEEDNFSNSKDNQILISPQLAKNYGYELGDKISIETQIGVKEYEIGAIAKETGLFLGVDNENLIVMTNSEVEEITEQENKSNVLMISLADKSNIKNSIKTLEENNDDFVVETLVDQETMDSNINMISQVLLIILILVLLMNYYVISSNAKVILLSRTPVVGTFRSLGASKIKVNSILVLENLVYGLLGGIFGVICGFYFRETILETIAQGVLSNAPLGEISAPINYVYIIFALIFAVIIQLISVIHVIYHIGNYSIKNLIFEELSSVQKVSIVLTVLGFVLQGFSYVLYRINNSYNLILAILALVFAMAGGILVLPFITKYLSLFMTKINKLIFGEAPSLGTRNISTSKIINSNIKLVVISLSMILMIFMTSSSLENLFVKAKGSFELDLQLYGMEKKENDYLKLKRVQGVKDLQFLYSYTNTLTVNGNEMNLILCGFEDERLGVKNKDGKIENLKNGEVMIDEFYAIKNGFEIGDQLEIESDDFKTKKIKVEIVGTIDSSIFTTARNTIVFSEDQFKKNVSDIPSSIYVGTDKNLTQMKKTLYKELSGENITVETFNEFIENQEQQVSGLLSMVWIFLILSILLSAIGLVNNQVIGFIQRKREYAVLYSVSMSKFQLNIMIFFEIISSFLIGCISGLVLSIWMSKLLGVLLSSIGIYLEFSFQWGNIFTVVGSIFVVLMLTAIIPIFKILRMNVIEEIKYE
ncbi:FtsX-like permease family protein [Clostridium sp. D2Q-14]|uniref:ABC transporter permease n=1 Tax=Anaeromonas gelatinilytica TaxID=2683194 RepID=UPI00193BAB6B|nr:ABC transporter permease [Anaeromonas gelatinilytica]MBS4535926.1 FtsX-like permease family protein [Anaeromonas gelatinilytica]